VVKKTSGKKQESKFLDYKKDETPARKKGEPSIGGSLLRITGVRTGNDPFIGTSGSQGKGLHSFLLGERLKKETGRSRNQLLRLVSHHGGSGKVL